ncbi:histamine H1 receptor [Aplochiton taeniatus]
MESPDHSHLLHNSSLHLHPNSSLPLHLLHNSSLPVHPEFSLHLHPNSSLHLHPNSSLPLHLLHNTMLGVSLGFLSLLTVVMNLLVLYAVRREKSLHTVGNLYIVSLSVADLLVGLVVMPLSLVYLLEDTWRLGRLLCQLWLIMDYVASTASIFSLFVLCLDRYRSVRQPLRYLKYRTRGRASVMIAGTWLLSLTWVIPILGWRSFTHVELKPEAENKCDTDFRFVTWFKVITSVFNFYVPSILMLWFYTRIYLAVRQHFRERERITHPTGSLGDIDQVHDPQMIENSDSKPPEQSHVEERSKEESLLDAPYSTDPTHRSEEDKRKNTKPKSDKNSSSSCHQTHLLSMDRGGVARLYVSVSECQVAVPNSVAGVCEITELANVHKYTTILYNNNKDLNQSLASAAWPKAGPDDRQEEEANAVTLKETWQRFCDQSRQRLHSLRLHKEHKAAKQLGFIIAAFMLCWIPYFLGFMVTAFCRDCVHHDLHMFTIWLGYINSTLNPFIYPLCNDNFKRVFKSILHIHP